MDENYCCLDEKHYNINVYLLNYFEDLIIYLLQSNGYLLDGKLFKFLICIITKFILITSKKNTFYDVP